MIERAHQLDPAALAKLGNLEIVAKSVVEGYLLGQHDSPYKGSSVEFVEHRYYYPGDDIRHIDWRAYGKTGEYYVKQFEEETNLRAWLLVDGSGSMRFAQSTLSKFAYATQLAAALSYLLLAQRDACGLMLFTDRVVDRIEPSTQRNAFERLLDMLGRHRPEGPGAPALGVHDAASSLKRRSLVVVLTDGFDDPEALATEFRLIRSSRHELIVFQIVTPEEIDFPFSRPTEFRDLERPHQPLRLDPRQFQSNYRRRFEQHTQALAAAAASAGAEFARLSTATPFEAALTKFLTARMS